MRLSIGRSRGLENEAILGDGLDLLPREEEREVLVLRPELEQVAIVRALRVARLPGGVRGDGVVPVGDVQNHAERRARGLVVSIAGVVEGRVVAPPGRRSHVELPPGLVRYGGTQRMVNEDVFELLLSVAPAVHIRSEPL